MPKQTIIDVAKVVSVSPNLIQIEIFDTETYKRLDEHLFIGSYLKVSDDNNMSVVAIVQSFRIRDSVSESEEEEQSPTFIIDAQPVGSLEGEDFRRGGQQIAIPPTRVELASDDDLCKIYESIDIEKQFSFGNLKINPKIRVMTDGDKFFGKHIGVVGSTGSGKSCTVAKILQEGIRQSKDQQQKGILNNSHIIIFDLHGEYPSAFPGANVISIDNLCLPYWLMNSEELEEMFIESREQNSHNQISQFKNAVIKNKEKYNHSIKVDYDMPVFFSLLEVYRLINNLNRSTKDTKTGELMIINKKDGIPIEMQLFDEIEFEEKKTAKINNGPYAGEFDRFISRLEAKLHDKRLDFLLHPRKDDGNEYQTDDFADILKQFTGYGDSKSNVTIIDLSGIPFEVLSIVVSLVSRLVFSFSFYFKRVKGDVSQEVPFLMVYEEAHNYIPQSEGARYKSVKRSIERIAKEGRKYGLSLMIVSQRPSEISETVFSQCNNFIAMRLTNPNDQNYVRRLLPDTISAITETLPMLEKKEAIIIGDATPIPSIVEVDEISDRPNSRDIDFHTEWKQNWFETQFEKVIKEWKKEDKSD